MWNRPTRAQRTIPPRVGSFVHARVSRVPMTSAPILLIVVPDEETGVSRGMLLEQELPRLLVGPCSTAAEANASLEGDAVVLLIASERLPAQTGTTFLVDAGRRKP